MSIENSSDPKPQEQNALQLKLAELSELIKKDGAEELKEARENFLKIYESLPIIGERLIIEYKKICASLGKDPGEIKLYMVGGRVVGKPLKPDSDIDLIFSVQNHQGSLETVSKSVDPQSALDMRQGSWDKLRYFLDQTCRDLGVVNLFHILNYGTTNLPEGLLLSQG